MNCCKTKQLHATAMWECVQVERNVGKACFDPFSLHFFFMPSCTGA